MTGGGSDLGALTADGLVVGYGSAPVIDGLSVRIPRGAMTAIIGPNACGKSTLLRAFARQLPPRRGSVRLGERDVRSFSARALAHRISLLPQTPVTPEAITVFELVSRGRYAHQHIFRRWSFDDERAVERALAAAGIGELRERRVDELSGGQRQRAWIALTLAQEADIMLLDEPTTSLDLAHQVEVLELVAGLRAEGRTVVAVLHELGLAARFADHVIAMRDGAIVAEGAPAAVLTESLLREAFGLRARVIADPDTGAPVVLPRAVHREE